MARHAAQDEQIREYVDHVGRLELAAHADGQALAGELAHLGQTAGLTTFSMRNLRPSRVRSSTKS